MRGETPVTTVVLFGSLGVAVDTLEWLLEQPGFTVLGVVCSRADRSPWRVETGDRNMIDHAPRLGVPVFDLDDAPAAEIGLSVRFHQILRRHHIDRYRLGVVNLHGAPLPEMRGSMCDAAAILEGRTEFGASLHWMNDKADAGDLLRCERFPIWKGDTVYTLFRQSNALGLRMIKESLADIVSGKIKGVPQGEGRTYRQAEVMRRKTIPADASSADEARIGRAFAFPGHTPPVRDVSRRDWPLEASACRPDQW